MNNICIIGGGASGIYAAINLIEKNNLNNITIFEKTSNILSKLSISGGGRCNLLNSFESVENYQDVYPRGHELIKLNYEKYDYSYFKQWFESHDIKLIKDKDNKIFPKSNKASEIIEKFKKILDNKRVKIENQKNIIEIKRNKDGKFLLNNDKNLLFDICIVSSGGGLKNIPFFHDFEIEFKRDVPSLYPLIIENISFIKSNLAGVLIENVNIRCDNTTTSGPVLFTHSGITGPACFTITSYLAYYLEKNNYKAILNIDYLPKKDKNSLSQLFARFKISMKNKKIYETSIRDLPKRVWFFILSDLGVYDDTTWGDLHKSIRKKIINNIKNFKLYVNGITKGKSEIVTAGGISLNEINIETMESKKIENLYFTGECLNVDGITGGYNLYNAWLTGYLASQNINNKD